MKTKLQTLYSNVIKSEQSTPAVCDKMSLNEDKLNSSNESKIEKEKYQKSDLEYITKAKGIILIRRNYTRVPKI